jgi:hypothetical protein
MAKIKTNYNADTKLVLLNDESNVVAIINVPKGADITEQVRLAIKEEFNATDVVFEGEADIDFYEFETNINIPFIFSDEDEDEFSKTFELVKAEEY